MTKLKRSEHSALPTVLLILSAMITVAVVASIMVLFTGCAHSAAGLARAQNVYSTVTNGLPILQTVSSVSSGTPWGAILGAVTTGLSTVCAAWGASLHKRIGELETTKVANPPQ